MKIYMDMCALKRPFDDQTKSRIWLEAQAVIRILDAFHNGVCEILGSQALVLENKQNPDPVRRNRVSTVLSTFRVTFSIDENVFTRAETLRELGLRSMDALHLAGAESAGVQCFVTCDDDVLKKGKNAKLKMKIMDPMEFVKEYDI